MSSEIVIKDVKKKGQAATLCLADGTSITLVKTIADEYGLRPGTPVTEQLIERLKNESDSRRALDYALYLLSRRSYSSGMLKKKMQEKGHPSKIISQIIDNLHRKGMLDDSLYARQTVETLLRRKPAGKSFLLAYLKSKLVPYQIASEAVTDSFQNLDEVEMAERLLRTRWRYLSKFELETARNKAYNYLSRRSLGYRAAKAAFDRLLREENKD